ncbi:oligodendrocyte-myelin glycoprotein [Esox lucius]|uniref:LRRNT domain-containing protein n=2 Tax=Esox lucius TaxID=8010 RepID=A0A3P8YKZ1_ESOLU|nr:oligodendrocyte-myelin glycoprotein [Esox lucius]XP_019902039.1 oligodendrocyte-myelin glycoprotein [Esox lucius]XP_019902044.1 oligodendrocyte-myelin glycoprotein [Esox lucius]XP_034147479.1 oligodendrocyte-myelin glycoprotein [Esox lucius]XP_034147480.1 oligodendrocyte-myelin glycoprotein [Esox lucius]
MERIRALITAPRTPLACLLLLLLSGVLGGLVLSICPSVCSCSRGHRVVDCSSRHLTHLPPGLQHNIRFLNLSHNSLGGLDGQLSHYAHLRTLDLSYNLLGRFPSGLPRALWDIRAAGNQLKALDKNDTAYHWNLRVLDLSANELERVVLINNTLPSLHALNLSHNRFWTVPTNMPYNLEVADLSHNYLVQILPGSLDRLPRLRRFYLHANRFSWVPEGVFDRLEGLELLTLGDNPWACEEEENITRLLRWAEDTRATVLGCPCYTRPTCGQAQLATPGGGWHFASYTEPPLGADSREIGRGGPPPARSSVVTSGYLAKSALLEPGSHGERGAVTNSGDQTIFVFTSTPTHRRSTSTTGLPRSAAKKPQPGSTRSVGHGLHTQIPCSAVAVNLLVTVAAFKSLLN